jgi:dTDP-glucose 4,6-dehydratase
MKILITGGCGFIGSYLTEKAVSAGFDVRVLGLACHLENIKHLVEEDKIEFVRGDVADPAVCKKVVQGVDLVSHLAALASVDQSIDDPRPFWEANVQGTINLLDAARTERVPRFHLHSSCEMFGNIEYPYKADETWPVLMPRSPYAVSKMSQEAYCQSYYFNYDFPIVITRGFNAYGPKQKAGHMGAVIPTFFRSVLNNKPPVINGNGEQTRDWTYVDDIAEGIFRCLTSDRVIGETIHLCSGIDRTVRDVAEMIIDCCGKSGELKPKQVRPRPGEMLRSIGDNSKAKKLLNWEPKMEFEDGLRKTADFYRELIQLGELAMYERDLPGKPPMVH